MKIEKINLLDCFKEESYHSSIILSYSIDLLFYETVVYKELRSCGSRNNIVLIDSIFYEQNVIENISLSTLSGKFYTLLPIHTSSLFHPKIICLFGEKYISILVGSGNLGTGGYSLNDELFCKIKFEVNEEQFQDFCSEVWTFINKYIVVLEGTFPFKQIKAIENEYKWLSRNNPNSSITQVNKDQIVSFIYPREKSVLEQFINHLKNDEIDELLIISPFFDEKCLALSEFEKKTKAKKINVIIQPDTVNLKYSALPKSSKFNFYNWLPVSNKYLHAKVYIAKCKKNSHILIGSSNCSVSGLLGNVEVRHNIESCIYSRVNDPDYFLDSLDIRRLTTSGNRITNTELKKIRYNKTVQLVQKTQTKLSYLELNGGNIFAYLESTNKSKKYDLILNDEREIGNLKFNSVSCQENIIKFVHNGIDPDKLYIGYIISDGGIESNKVILSYYKILETNAPSPKASQFYEIIEKIDFKNSEFLDLIAPFEKLIFYSSTGGDNFNFTKKEMGKKQKEDDNSIYDYISYDEFLSKTKKILYRPDQHIFSQSGSIALLIEFLLSKIGIHKENGLSPELKENDIDLKIYEEELADEFLWTKPDDYYSFAKKENIKRLDRSEAKYLKNRILKLGNTYITYLDQITKGIKSRNLMPPKHLDSIELVKYFSISLLLNYFAGKEYKIGNEVIETIELDGTENKSYWYLVLNIIAFVFCYQDKTENQFNVLKKIQVDKNFNSIPEDFIAALSLAAFNICFIWEYFKDDEWKELEVLAYKFFINTQIYIDQIDENKIKFHFEKYFDNSGFKEKRNPLSQKHIIQLSDILKRYKIIKDRVVNMSKRLDGIEKIYNDGKGHFPQIGLPCYVWNPRFGLSYAYEVSSPSVYLYEWGHSEEKVGFHSAFVIKVDMQS